jgi:hypothetical protein
MRHHKVIEWERTLKNTLDTIDDFLENKYGHRYRLHPARAERGTTSNKSHDGLFNIGASFTAGYGSEYGRGYVIEVDMITLEDVPDHIEKQIEQEVMQYLREELPKHFPGKNLKINKDRNVIKIHGDLSLGKM